MTRAPDLSRAPGRGAILALLLVLTLAPALVACGGGDDGDAAPTPSASAAPRSAVVTIGALLRRRAEAVRTGDRRAFLATVGGGPTFRRSQAAWFDRMRTLPLGAYALGVEQRGVVREGERFRAVVDVRTRLTGFDAATVTTRARYLLVPGPRAGSVRVGGVVDAAWERRNRVVPAPWDLDGVTVRRAGDVLGLFDDATLPAAPRLLAAVQRGVDDVAAQVPSEWSRRVVVSVLGSRSLLDAVAPGRGGESADLDGVAYEVPADVMRPEGALAATRVVLAPQVLQAGPTVRDRLIRHELTHVALGRRDDRAPVWLQEGIAEWVSTRALRPWQRLVPAAALDLARSRPRSLPDAASFNDADGPAHYALAWYACEEIASTSPQTLWSVLDAFADAPEGEPADADEVLRSWVGVDQRWLAARAARLMISTYAPEPSSSSDPSSDPSPSETSVSPTPAARG